MYVRIANIQRPMIILFFIKYIMYIDFLHRAIIYFIVLAELQNFFFNFIMHIWHWNTDVHIS